MSEENKTVEITEQTATQAETKGDTKTFTQEQLNAIVQKRLAEYKARQDSELDRREQELREREFRLNSRQTLINRGFDESLLDILKCNDENSLSSALDILDKVLSMRNQENANAGSVQKADIPIAKGFSREEVEMLAAYRKENGEEPEISPPRTEIEMEVVRQYRRENGHDPERGDMRPFTGPKKHSFPERYMKDGLIRSAMGLK